MWVVYMVHRVTDIHVVYSGSRSDIHSVHIYKQFSHCKIVSSRISILLTDIQ